MPMLFVDNKFEKQASMKPRTNKINNQSFKLAMKKIQYPVSLKIALENLRL